MKKIVTVLILLYPIILLNAQSNYYVALNGNNNNNGTISQPFKTVFKASQVAQPGDNIYVRGGVYRNTDFNDGDIWNGSSAGRIICNGASGSYITFQPYQNEEVVFEFDDNYGIQISNSSYVIFRGFKIKGIAENITYTEAQSNWGLYMLSDQVYNIVGNENLLPLPASVTKPSYYNGRGLVANSSHHIKLQNNIVYNCPSSAIRGEQSDYIEISGNQVYNNTYWTTQGVGAITISEATNIDNLNTVKIIIERNLVRDNENKMISWNPTKSFITYVIDEGSGIFLTRNNDTYLYGKMKISNNISYNNGASGIVSHFTDRAIITFNTVCFNGANNDGFPGGIGINTTNDVIIANNIIYARPTKWAIGTVAQPNTNFTIASNIVYNENSAQSVYNNLSNGWINTNPLFIDAINYNFNLLAASPAINSSSTVYTENVDFNNNFRNIGVNDIGALEFNPALQTENFEDLDIKFFPNPTRDYLFIKRSNIMLEELKIYDLLGRECSNWNEISTQNDLIILDVSQFSKGIYLLMVNNSTFKIVKD